MTDYLTPWLHDRLPRGHLRQRLFLSPRDVRWFQAVLGSQRVVHDPAPPPTLDDDAVRGARPL